MSPCALIWFGDLFFLVYFLNVAAARYTVRYFTIRKQSLFDHCYYALLLLDSVQLSIAWVEASKSSSPRPVWDRKFFVEEDSAKKDAQKAAADTWIKVWKYMEILHSSTNEAFSPEFERKVLRLLNPNITSKHRITFSDYKRK